ncbi:hypothetical protein HMPREF0208_00226 [Citrobacter koseri]|nr:hypothetical protein HMPREF3220_01044 [Citrobacter koseri]KXA05913.1 hypothetical protein HMPREF3207_00535 [Citrobacter koseri]KXB47268.1 hypothetical protein HMPREF0208_00226 [Citrobacter koseri]
MLLFFHAGNEYEISQAKNLRRNGFVLYLLFLWKCNVNCEVVYRIITGQIPFPDDKKFQ